MDYLDLLYRKLRKLDKIIWSYEHMCGDYPRPDEMGDVYEQRALVDMEIAEKTGLIYN